MWKQMLPALRMTVLMTALTGLLYPGLVTALCQVLFPSQANGSLLTRGEKVVGSALIGQAFTRSEYFQPRPSAADYDGTASGGSNLGPTSQKLIDRTRATVTKLQADNPAYGGAIPADLATASASGLDPHLSPAAIEMQIARVANARKQSADEIRQVAAAFEERRDLGFLGEPRVNVLRLNLALDQKFPIAARPAP